MACKSAVRLPARTADFPGTPTSEEEVVGGELDRVGKNDPQVGCAVAVHVGLHLRQDAVDLEPEFAGVAAEAIRADKAEGLVPSRTGIGVDLLEVDHIVVQAFKVGDRVRRAASTVRQISEEEGVCAKFASQHVPPAAAVQRVVTRAAVDLVTAVAAVQPILAGEAVQQIPPTKASQPIADRA